MLSDPAVKLQKYRVLFLFYQTVQQSKFMRTRLIFRSSLISFVDSIIYLQLGLNASSSSIVHVGVFLLLNYHVINKIDVLRCLEICVLSILWYESLVVCGSRLSLLITLFCPK